ncbi:MAG TPA: CaiB/BaiF CoA-transferase family protein, partial [Bacteroidota bacterium]|nr:CaiB/BaiF CoA-transferase family protein [Bacteroidota bacterium]
KPAYDQIIQGLSGEMAINGDERLNPLRAGFPVCDTVGGLNAAFAIMAALYHRERTGEGQCIDVALLDSIMPLMGWVVANLMIGGQMPVLMGNDNFTAAPSGVFRTRDGYINIAANKQEQWESVADLLALEELKADPRFRERENRKKNRQELTPLLEGKLMEKETARWVEELNAHDVPAGAILPLQAAVDQPQVSHRRTFSTVAVPGIGEIRLFNLTAKFSRTPGCVTDPPPALGEHTLDVLANLGYTREDAARLKSAGVV